MKPDNGQAGIIGKYITIRVSIESLTTVVAEGVDMMTIDPPVKVLDPKAFAQEVVYALNQEDEDGTTPIHRLFDQAFSAAAENGSQGVQLGQWGEYGEIVWDKA